MAPKLFIDGSNISYLCKYVAEKKPNAMQAFPGIYKGVTGKLQRDHPFHEMIFAWEGSGNSIKHRLEIFLEYKQQREHDPTVKVFRELAKELNRAKEWLNVEVPETEADDVIYALANIYKSTADNNIVISADHDYIQMVQEGLVSKVYSYPTKSYLKIPDYDIVKYKCLVGDVSDNIPGVRGCGPKTAMKYLEHGIPTEHMRTVRMFYNIVSMKAYSIKHNMIYQVKEILTSLGVKL